MKVSIIIPVYNVAEYIESCLWSVANQTYKNIEVLLIDDCGTDSSMQIVTEFIEKFSLQNQFVICKHKQNRGLSAARNTGIINSSGDYLFFLDSDDEITFDCVEKLVSTLNGKTNINFVIGNYKVNGNGCFPALKMKDSVLENNNFILQSYLNKEWYEMAWNKLINKDFIIQNDLFFKEGLVHEDSLWSFMLACTAISMIVITDTTYIYRIRSGSIMDKSDWQIRVDNYIKILLLMNKFILNKNLHEKKDIYLYIELFKLSILENQIRYNYSKKVYFSNYAIIARNSCYVSPIRAIFKFRLGIKKVIKNFFYALPTNLGAACFYFSFQYSFKKRKTF